MFGFRALLERLDALTAAVRELVTVQREIRDRMPLPPARESHDDEGAGFARPASWSRREG